MKKSQQFAVFDIDGTIFRSSLLIELNAKLVHDGYFPETARGEVARLRGRWLDRTGSYQQYIDTIINLYSKDIRGARVTTIQRVARELIAEQKNRVYVFTRNLILKLRKTHTLIVISFSPNEVVYAFNAVYKFDIASGIVYPSSQGRYVGGIDPAFPLDKKIILQGIVKKNKLSYGGSIGVGDTESDIGFLSLVEKPIAFNPNEKLYRIAKKHNWRVIVERKDVIYTL